MLFWIKLDPSSVHTDNIPGNINCTFAVNCTNLLILFTFYMVYHNCVLQTDSKLITPFLTDVLIIYNFMFEALVRL